MDSDEGVVTNLKERKEKDLKMKNSSKKDIKITRKKCIERNPRQTRF